MKLICISLALVILPAAAVAGQADGVWKTEPNGSGGYLEVTMAPCASDATKTCGMITGAFKKDGPDPSYVNLGKPIVADMTSSDGIHYAGGTIWDPENGKTYNSKMTVKGDDLDVEGCISFICSGQDWKRVK